MIISLDFCPLVVYNIITKLRESLLTQNQPIQETTMAGKYRDIIGMQLDMLVKSKRYNELNPSRPTRKASGEIVTDPKTGLKFKVVG